MDKLYWCNSLLCLAYSYSPLKLLGYQTHQDLSGVPRHSVLIRKRWSGWLWGIQMTKIVVYNWCPRHATSLVQLPLGQAYGLRSALLEIYIKGMTFNFHWICKPSLLLEGPSLLSEKQKIFSCRTGALSNGSFSTPSSKHYLWPIFAISIKECFFWYPGTFFKWQVLLYGWKLLRNTNAAVLRTWIHPCCLAMFHGSYLFSHIFFLWQFVRGTFKGTKILCKIWWLQNPLSRAFKSNKRNINMTTTQLRNDYLALTRNPQRQPMTEYHVRGV